MTAEHIHFVTGRLAENALRSTVAKLAEKAGFRYSIDVLPITVAALMTPKWIARHVRAPEVARRVIVPGYCNGELLEIEAKTRLPVDRGPKDLRQLPEFFGERDASLDDYGSYDIQILAEINHAPRLGLAAVLQQAEHLRSQGADVIDVGCDPGEPWLGVADCVRALRDAGHRVSIDSLQTQEIERAVKAGAELVLSVNHTNREAACDWGCEVVVIPDDIGSLGGFHETVEYLANRDVTMRLDPVVEPIGCGFAESLVRYVETRRQYPQAEMLMGVGNLSELTDVDSAGVNVLLLGFCQEIGIRSVLTTEVINWARTSVRECDLARRLVHFAVRQQRPPKHFEPNLVILRDPQLFEFSSEDLADLASQLKDPNYRILVSQQSLHLMSAGIHLRDADPFQLFAQLLRCDPTNLDASHAFYLGYELAKAAIALALGKQYEQDHALRWGYLSVEEKEPQSRNSAE